MPPQANDNQGLKIAVAVFVTLTVFLAVATYFGFSEAGKQSERADQAAKDAQDAKSNQQSTYQLFEKLKEKAGFAKAEDTAVVEQITKKRNEDYKSRIAGIANQMTEAANKVKEAAGAEATPQIDLYTGQAANIATNFEQSPNPTLDSDIDYLINMMSNEAQLLSAVASHYQLVRKDLEAANQIAQSKVQTVEQSRDEVQADHMAELTKHEEDRRGLINRLDELQTRNQEQATQINTLTNELAQLRQETETARNNLLAQYRQVREQLELKNDNTLAQANGRINFVDYTRDEVRTTLGRRDGAREQMVFSVFDKAAPGLPTDKPKATIELIRVGDAESIGRITKKMDTVNPIRYGDQVYSPAFGKQTFALIGKIDVDRDGKDDRDNLKRMILAAGGEVAFDLPPPGAGTRSGELTPDIDWYVLDDRGAFRPGTEANAGASAEEEAKFQKEQSAALTEARLAGIRPIRISRLLDYLGYTFGQPGTGRVEGRDRQAIQKLLNPRGIQRPAAGAGATSPDADADAEPDAMPGDEEPAGDDAPSDGGFPDF
jgi:hypothetical protein